MDAGICVFRTKNSDVGDSTFANAAWSIVIIILRVFPAPGLCAGLLAQHFAGIISWNPHKKATHGAVILVLQVGAGAHTVGSLPVGTMSPLGRARACPAPEPLPS